jgi:hypothetical protein
MTPGPEPRSGYKAVAAVLDNCPLQGAAKLLLLGIARHYPDAYPGLDTLAGYANVNVRNAQRWLRQLEAEGWVVTAVNGGGRAGTRNDRRTNRYAINWERLAAVDTPAPASGVRAAQRGGCAPASAPRGGVPARTGWRTRANGVADAPPEQTREQTREQTHNDTGAPTPAAPARDAALGRAAAVRDAVASRLPDRVRQLERSIAARWPSRVHEAWAAMGVALTEWLPEGLTRDTADAAMADVARLIDSGHGDWPSYTGHALSRHLGNALAPGHDGTERHEEVSEAIRMLFTPQRRYGT